MKREGHTHEQDHPRPRGHRRVAAPLAVAATANAATADADGIITVTKGDIQHAMGWNNAAWDS